MPLTWADKMDHVLVVGRDLFGRNVTYRRTGFADFAMKGIPDRIPRLEDQNIGQFTSVSFRALDFIDAPFAASVLLSYTGSPHDGDTITIDGLTYTYKTVIDNTVARQVARGADAQSAATKLLLAINAASGAGTSYSSATVIHPTCYAESISATVIRIVARTTGPSGNGLSVTESLYAANLSATETDGGTPVKGDQVILDGVLYDVTDFGPDAEGEVQCRLRKAATP